MLIDGPIVVLTARVCARLEGLADLADRQARREGLPLPIEVREVLDEIRAAGRGYRAHAREVTAAIGSCGSAADDDFGMVPVMSTSAVAALLGTRERNVRDLASRGALPARHVGRAWAFDPADVAEYLTQRQEAS